MNFLALPLFVLLLISAVTVYGDLTEKGIKDYLANLENKAYDKRIPPEGNDGPGSPVRVVASMFILDINKVDELNMDFNAHFYFRQSWNDSRLEHRKDNDDILLRNVDKLWTPDLFFVEERKGSLHQVIHPNQFFKIKPNGEVLYSVKLGVTFSCPMDLRKFPHDVQKCTMNVESYGFQRKHISLEWNPKKQKYGPLGISEEITLLDFDIVEVTPSSRNITFTFGEYSSLQINLTLKRKFGFFAIRLYVPFIILVLMSILSLWIRAGERCLRLSLLLVILYLMVTIASEVNSLIPPAPYTKASDVWIGFCESLVFAIFLEFVAVSLIRVTVPQNIRSESKGEIILCLDPEAKEHTLNTDSLKSPLSKLINMFDARNGGEGRRNDSSNRIDRICRIVVPFIFILFNIVYWSVYCTS